MAIDYCTDSVGEESGDPLLPKQSDDYGTVERERKPQPQRHKKYIPLEVISFLYFTQYQLMLSHIQFFLHAEATEHYDNLHPMNGTQGNDTTDREDAIQGQATLSLLIIVGITMFLSLLPTFISGTFSNWYGRRKPMLLVSFGATFYCLNVILVVAFEVNVYYICFGAVVNGICGNFATMNTSIFSIVSDITPSGTQRAWRTVLVNTTMYVGTFLGVLVTGVWVEASGYLNVLYLGIASNVTSLFVIIFFVPETKAIISGGRPRFKETCNLVKDRFSFLTRDDGNHSRLVVRLSYIAIVLTCAVDGAKVVLLSMFFLGPPLLWKSAKISLFISIRSATALLIIPLTTRCLQRYLSHLHIAIIGAISNIAMYTLIGSARNDVMVYIAGACSVYVEMLLPMLRSHMSHIVLPTEQGSMQSLVASCEIFSISCFAVVVGIIYNATLSFFPGFVLILMAITMVIIIGLLLYISRLMKRNNTHGTNTTIEYLAKK